MNQTEKPLNVNIDIKSSTPLTSPDGNHVFAEGVIIRKVSKFVAGTAEDAVIPIPVFMCSKCGHVNEEFLPKNLPK